MLVEFVGHIGEFFGRFPCRLAVADVCRNCRCRHYFPGWQREFVSAVVAEVVVAGGLRSTLLGAGGGAF